MKRRAFLSLGVAACAAPSIAIAASAIGSEDFKSSTAWPWPETTERHGTYCGHDALYVFKGDRIEVFTAEHGLIASAPYIPK